MNIAKQKMNFKKKIENNYFNDNGRNNIKVQLKKDFSKYN